MSSKLTPDKLLTAKQVGELLGLSASAVYQGKGGTAGLTRVKLDPEKANSGIRWSRNEVLSLIQRRVQDAKNAATPRLFVPERRSNVIRLKSRKPALTRTEINEVMQSVLNKRKTS